MSTLMSSMVCSEAFANVAEDKIGEVVFARGAVSAKSSSGAIRILGKQSPVYQGDIITTGPKSFSVLKMIDDSRISIRPETVFSFEDYSFNKGEDSAVMKLFKGGLRTISGLIGKRTPEAYKLDTAVATIGIRGTEFDARLCDVDCTIENHEQKKKKVVIAKVAFLRNEASAVSKDNKTRKLKIGSEIYEGDKLITGKKAYAVIAFNDKSRMTLKADSEVKIEEHKFISTESEQNSAVYRLLKGGFRALTGLISKKNKKAYKVKTPTATIGIRGTGYDLNWAGACTGGGGSCGLSAAVWSGAIYAQNDSGEFELLVNQAFQIRFIDAPAINLDVPPVFDVPRPDEVNINFDELFTEQIEEVPSGLYVNTRQGKVFMERDGQIIEMTPGQGGFVSTDGSLVVKLDVPRSFQTNDPYLDTINEEFESLFDLLGNDGFEQSGNECIVQ